MNVKNQIHYWLKPSMEFLGKITGHTFTNLAADKDKNSWDNPNVQELRGVFDEWYDTEISDGKTKTLCGRPYLRQIFDCICICGDVEGKFTDARIDKFIEIAKERGFF